MNSLQAAHFDHKKPVKIISHGWNSDGDSLVNTLITKGKYHLYNISKLLQSSSKFKIDFIPAFLKEDDVNVIVVDWRKGANVLYTSACKNVHKIGPYIAELVDWLIDIGTPAKSFHLMGHSLGAHIMGVAGRSLTKGTIPYITGKLSNP